MVESLGKAGRPVVTLTTDFGTADSYVAEMKAVILSLCPEAVLVDITHEVERFNIRMGAYLLARSAWLFPQGTVHLAVVDPEVGGGRKAIILETPSAFFVGPDNGLLTAAAGRQGISHAYQIKEEYRWPSKVSETFHGRDLFAPAAGYLAAGKPPTSLGVETSTYVESAFPAPRVSDRMVEGEIIHVDRFGNLVTNIDRKIPEARGLRFGSVLQLQAGKIRHPKKVRFAETYSQASKGELLLTVGSGGFLEVSVNQGDASKRLGLKAGKKVKLFFPVR